MRYIRFILYSICCALFFVFACGKVDLQIDTGVLRPDEPPSITLFAPRDGLVADLTNRFVFEWAASVPYTFTLIISTNADLSVPTVEDVFEYPSYMQEDYINVPLPVLTPTAEAPNPKAKVYWAVRGVRESGSLPVWSVTNVIYPKLEPLSIVISEVCYRTKMDSSHYYSDGDFVELYNTTDYAVDVGGWTLKHSDKSGEPSKDANAPAIISIPFGNVIPSKGFLVLANTSAQFDSAFDQNQFKCVRLNLKIPSVSSTSEGFQFELLDRSGEPHDMCNSMQGVTMPKEPATAGHPQYSSYERVYPFQPYKDADGNVIATTADWAIAESSGSFVVDNFKGFTWATPGEANSIWVGYPGVE